MTAAIVLSVGADAALNIWTLGAEAEPTVHNINDHNGAAYTCAYNTTATMFASGSGDTTVRVYDMETCASLRLFGTMGTKETEPAMGHSSTVASVEFFKESPHLLLSAGWDSSFKVWDTRKDGKACVLTTENAHSEVVSCAHLWEITGSSQVHQTPPSKFGTSEVAAWAGRRVKMTLRHFTTCRSSRQAYQAHPACKR